MSRAVLRLVLSKLDNKKMKSFMIKEKPISLINRHLDTVFSVSKFDLTDQVRCWCRMKDCCCPSCWLTVSGVVVIFICINIVVRGDNISALVNYYFWRTKHNKGTDSHPHQPLDVANFWRIFIHKVQDPALYEGFESLMNNTKFKIDIVILLFF